MRENVGEMSENVQGKAKAATASVREKADGLKPKAKVEKPVEAPETITPETITIEPKPKTTATPAATPAPKKRGRPAGSKNKTTSTSKSTTTSRTGKRGPKPGTKIPRDADGNLLKKDGTPRKKPGPKK